MGKPSSSSTSLKKKRSKASSKVRIKKTSKTKKRSKSKKSSRRRHDSDSYSSDCDSLSSSTASSEEDYRRRSKKRARSPSKKISRRSKKRSQGQLYSAESSEDLPSRKKRKGSKRDGKLGARMKRTRKKSKKRVSVSSASSGSYCSTCAESSSESGQIESQSYRASSERKDKDRWTAEKGKTELKSPGSYSPISHRSISGGDESDEKMRSMNNSMRLRSVIMVNNEDRELHAYGHKEEITYDNDDYPSCKSNDSNDSGSKRELTHHPLVDSEVKRQVDSEKDEEAVVSDMNTTAITDDSQKNGNNISSVIVGTIHAVRDNESNVSGGSDGNDLESMLRQRALENLKKFRGVHKNTAALSAQKENVDGKKKQSLIATSESSHHKFPEDNVATAPPVEDNCADSDSSVKRDFISINSNDASLGDKGYKIVPAIRRQSSEVRPDHGHSGFKESGSTRQSVVKLLHEGTSIANVKQEVIPTFASNASNPRVTSYTWRRESAKVQAPSKELRPSLGLPQAKPMVTKGIGGKTAIEIVGTENKVDDNEVHEKHASLVGTENKVDDNEVHEKHASPAPELPSRSESMSGAGSSDKDGNDAKDGPQYEQKTMSVTRGGETIQVNYQVYIPKRAPALARRQLQR